MCDAAGICDTTTIIYTLEPSCDNFNPLDDITVLTTSDCAQGATLCLEDLPFTTASQYVFLIDGVPVASSGLSSCANNGISFGVSTGFHTILLTDTINACADTAIVAVLCEATDTIYSTMAALSTRVFCHPQLNLSLLPDGLNALDTAYLSCMPQGVVSPSNPLGCFAYTAPAAPTTDTICWTVCDVLGHCETQVYIITAIEQADTINLTLVAGLDSVVCISVAGSGLDVGQIFDVFVGCNALVTTSVTISPPDTCLLLSPEIPGNDTTCLVVCDSLGQCDTTYLLLTVLPALDTTAFAARPDTITVCTSGVYNLLSNDQLAEGVDTLFLLTIPSKGIARIFADTAVYYEVVDDRDLPFIDQFSYVICRQNQCDTAVVLVDAICDRPVVVYNGLSPNGDFFNDLWVIEELPNYPNRVQVYNRWGNRVFFKENYQNDWGGTWRSDNLPDGTYFYLVEYEKDGDWIQLSGYLQLHR